MQRRPPSPALTFLLRKHTDPSRYDLYTAIKGPFGTTTNLHPFPEIDVTERFPDDWAASAGLCTGDNSALLEFRAPRHDFWGGSGDLELLAVDGSLLNGVITVEEVKVVLGELLDLVVSDKISVAKDCVPETKGGNSSKWDLNTTCDKEERCSFCCPKHNSSKWDLTTTCDKKDRCYFCCSKHNMHNDTNNRW